MEQFSIEKVYYAYISSLKISHYVWKSAQVWIKSPSIHKRISRIWICSCTSAKRRCVIWWSCPRTESTTTRQRSSPNSTASRASCTTVLIPSKQNIFLESWIWKTQMNENMITSNKCKGTWEATNCVIPNFVDFMHTSQRISGIWTFIKVVNYSEKYDSKFWICSFYYPSDQWTAATIRTASSDWVSRSSRSWSRSSWRTTTRPKRTKGGGTSPRNPVDSSILAISAMSTAFSRFVIFFLKLLYSILFEEEEKCKQPKVNIRIFLFNYLISLQVWFNEPKFKQIIFDWRPSDEYVKPEFPKMDVQLLMDGLQNLFYTLETTPFVSHYDTINARM